MTAVFYQKSPVKYKALN